ncbi:Hypothetical protein LCAZH_2934 [Lacticaseibacillus paracasei]|uniref:Uncharacterized protein n=3 Tax=Lacticaseibacillus paracasei subsp. paracasei TaxID=47714 RepID=S2P255_LACPA|nr:Hypothetical protein LCAZH_2934 [Lacticaseibacillus paracasei]EPC16972.1 hypothetical protein Lpp226_2656 [Lacticaseibacillus paracasei subsp. paracasei Lpp226]EPC23156.1 hypothetical protein Lpp17_2432 [Lacticaseibacillus paracasei subsp. paracasei Lpp17]EPC25306.1 hypothetical protein Lpp46_2173 [Lacticaseibacillus paracasei subsp. paracasei Lpp46]EPC30461.1 hypothetical protein Lpp22_1145 [Lacticaseibacillus paracasei subsp. paracasei Lpp22]EPC31021.1 hypothetical protein Lpp223_2638 [La
MVNARFLQEPFVDHFFFQLIGEASAVILRQYSRFFAVRQ